MACIASCAKVAWLSHHLGSRQPAHLSYRRIICIDGRVVRNGLARSRHDTLVYARIEHVCSVRTVSRDRSEIDGPCGAFERTGIVPFSIVHLRAAVWSESCERQLDVGRQ